MSPSQLPQSKIRDIERRASLSYPNDVNRRRVYQQWLIDQAVAEFKISSSSKASALAGVNFWGRALLVSKGHKGLSRLSWCLFFSNVVDYLHLRFGFLRTRLPWFVSIPLMLGVATLAVLYVPTLSALIQR